MYGYTICVLVGKIMTKIFKRILLWLHNKLKPEPETKAIIEERVGYKIEVGTPDPLGIISEVEKVAEDRDFYEGSDPQREDIVEHINSVLVVMLPESSQVERTAKSLAGQLGATTFSIKEKFEDEYITLPGTETQQHWKSRRSVRYFMKLYRWCDECEHDYGVTAILDYTAKDIEKDIAEEKIDVSKALDLFSLAVETKMKRLSPSMVCPVHGEKLIESDQPTE